MRGRSAPEVGGTDRGGGGGAVWSLSRSLPGTLLYQPVETGHGRNPGLAQVSPETNQVNVELPDFDTDEVEATIMAVYFDDTGAQTRLVREVEEA